MTGVLEPADWAGAFAAFFEAEHPGLLRALFVVTVDAGEAEDIAQEAFLKVWQRWGLVQRMEDPVGYLYRTALNLFRSRYRRALLATRRVLGRRRSHDPMGAAEARAVLAEALRGLTPRQREALVLTELLGYGSADAARLLGVRPVTVRVLASQARAALRDLLGG